MHDDLASIRVDYDGDGFSAADAGDDPMATFVAWFGDARGRDTVAEANAMTLATATAAGVPSARMVLLKAIDPAQGSFTWYTNLRSRKAVEAATTGAAALCWWWPGTPGRQVRAVGRVEEVAVATARSYFDSRPLDARIGATTSRQSRAVAARATLDARAAELRGTEPQLPDTWGGLTLVVDELEFWQGRSGRLHDRVTFLRLDAGGAIRSSAAVAAAGGDDALRAAGSIVTDPHGTRWLRARLEP